MTYINYPHRGNLADIVFDENYDYWADYDKEYERFDYSNLTKKEKEALREWSNFNGISGEREDAPYIAMNFYVKHLLAGVPASKIKGVSRKHKQQVHTIADVLKKYSQPIMQSPLYRAMGTIPEALEDKSVGDAVILDRIIATSTSPVAISGFGGSDGAVMVIKDAYGIPAYKGEQEFILAPGSRFIISDIYRADWEAQYHISLENLTVFEVTMVANENKLHVFDGSRPWWK